MTDDALRELREWRRDMDRRVTKLEQDRAVEAERYSNIVSRLEKIDGAVSKVVWLIIAVIIGGLLNFMMNGGLNVPTP